MKHFLSVLFIAPQLGRFSGFYWRGMKHSLVNATLPRTGVASPHPMPLVAYATLHTGWPKSIAAHLVKYGSTRASETPCPAEHSSDLGLGVICEDFPNLSICPICLIGFG